MQSLQIVILKQYKITDRKKKEITVQISDMLEAGVLVPKNSLYNISVRLMKKADGSWRLIVDCQGLNKIVPPIASADSEIV